MNTTISWAPTPLATLYELYRDTDPMGPFTVLVYSGVSVSFMDSNLTPGSIYYYKVRATTPLGITPLSSELTVSVPLSNQPVRPTSMRQAVGPAAVQFEYQNALLDTQAMEWEYGQGVSIHIRGEDEITRDTYGSIVSRPLDLYTMVQNAAEISYQPTRKQLEKAGLREETDAIIYVAMQDFIDKGLSFDDLEIKRMSIDIHAIPGEVNGTRYEVKEKSRAGAFGNGYLYITFGLRRG